MNSSSYYGLTLLDGEARLSLDLDTYRAKVWSVTVEIRFGEGCARIRSEDAHNWPHYAAELRRLADEIDKIIAANAARDAAPPTEDIMQEAADAATTNPEGD